MKKETPIVSICCITYNHANYIRKTIESFLSQRTSFPFEIIIHDDASTDNTSNIIREFAEKYPDIIVPIFQIENQYSKKQGSISARFVFPKVKGKYIANCEGDDYWTDPLKLQKQVEFLEANEDYGLIHTDLDEYDTIKKKWVRGLWKQSNRNRISGDIYDYLMFTKNFGIYYCTMCFRSQYVQANKEYDDVNRQNFMYGDVPLYLHIARNSKIGYIPERTAVRNVLGFSATQGQSFEYMIQFRRTALSIFEYFNQIRPVNTDLKTIYKAHKLIELEVCYSYYKKSEFLSLYKSLNKNDKNYLVHLQRFGIKNNFNYIISKLLLKAISVFKNIFR